LLQWNMHHVVASTGTDSETIKIRHSKLFVNGNLHGEVIGSIYSLSCIAQENAQSKSGVTIPHSASQSGTQNPVP